MSSHRLGRYQQLLSAASNADREDFGELIVHLGIPPDLSFLLEGLRSTSQILHEHAQEFDSLLELVDGFWADTSAILDAIERLYGFAGNWAAADDRVIRAQISRRPALRSHPHPLHGYCILVCQHWSNLFCQPPLDSGPLIAKYAAIQAKVTLYVLALQVRERDSGFLAKYANWAQTNKQPDQEKGPTPSRISAASLSLRRLSDPRYASVLEALSGPGTLTDRVSSATEHLGGALAGATDPSGEVQRILDAFRLLEEDLFDRVQRTASHGRRGAQGTRRIRLPFGHVKLAGQHVIANIDQIDDNLAVTQFFGIPAEGSGENDDESVEVEAEAGPLGDTADQLDITLFSLSPNGKTGKYRGLVSESMVGQLRRLMCVPTHDGLSLSDWQVGRISADLQAHESRLEPGPRLLMRVLLATGRNPRVNTFGVRRSANEITVLPSKPESLPRTLFAQEQAAWYVEVPPPAFGAVDREPAEREPSCWLELPDLLGAAAALKDTNTRRVLKDPSYQKESLKAIDHWLDRWLWNPSVRHNQITGWLFRRLLEVCGGNPTIAVYITGQSRAHARTTQHYTSVDQALARAKYREALSPLLKKCPAVAGGDTLTSSIGARRVPTLSAVRDLVARMLQAVREAQGESKRDALTAYTMLGLHLGVAARPREIRFLDFVDRDCGLARLEEKGTRYDQRVVALPPVVSRQLVVYEKAVDSWGGQPNHNTGIFLKQSGSGIASSPFTPADFRALASQHGFTLELYSLRRFVRTELTTRGADGEDLDALMGHWYACMSPHDPLSMYPVQRLVKFARTEVQRLLDDVGYRCLE